MCLLICTSCHAQNNLSFEPSQIDKIDVFQGFPGTELKMKIGFEKEFISELNASQEVGPTKYMRTHRFLIYNNNSDKIDTLLSNGIIHQYNGWYKSKENLIEKYKEPTPLLSDTIVAHLKVVERLTSFMENKNYEDAILLFSLKYQKKIRAFQKNKEQFKYWCTAWTLSPAMYTYYTGRIKEGRGHFIYEENEWRINEK